MATSSAAVAEVAAAVAEVDVPMLHFPQGVAHGMPVAFNAAFENVVAAFCGKDSHSVALHMVTNSSSPLSTDALAMFQEGSHFTLACTKVQVVGSWGRAHICTLLFRWKIFPLSDLFCRLTKMAITRMVPTFLILVPPAWSWP